MQQVPHFYLTIGCEIGKLLAACEEINAVAPKDSEKEPLYKLSVNGKIEIAQIMSMTLSCDHRAIDGALGAELIGAFKVLIENPVMMTV